MAQPFTSMHRTYKKSLHWLCKTAIDIQTETHFHEWVLAVLNSRFFCKYIFTLPELPDPPEDPEEFDDDGVLPDEPEEFALGVLAEPFTGGDGVPPPVTDPLVMQLPIAEVLWGDENACPKLCP